MELRGASVTESTDASSLDNNEQEGPFIDGVTNVADGEGPESDGVTNVVEPPAGTFVGFAFHEAKRQIADANERVRLINSQDVDSGKMVFDILNDPSVQDPEVRKFQEWEEKVIATLEAKRKEAADYVEKKLLPKRAEDVDVEAETAKYKELRASINSILKAVVPQPDYNEEVFNALPPLLTLRGKVNTTTQNSGVKVKRPRLAFITVDGEDAAKETKDSKTGETKLVRSFTTAALLLSKKFGHKVESNDLREAAFKVAQTEDLGTVGGMHFEFPYYSTHNKETHSATVAFTPLKSEAATE